MSCFIRRAEPSLSLPTGSPGESWVMMTKHWMQTGSDLGEHPIVQINFVEHVFNSATVWGVAGTMLKVLHALKNNKIQPCPQGTNEEKKNFLKRKGKLHITMIRNKRNRCFNKSEVSFDWSDDKKPNEWKK